MSVFFKKIRLRYLMLDIFFIYFILLSIITNDVLLGVISFIISYVIYVILEIVFPSEGNLIGEL